MSTLFVILLVVCTVIGVVLYIKYQKKFPRFGTIMCITGSPKTGKTLTAVYLACRDYKRRLRIWKIKCWFCKAFKKWQPEKPLLYSNIPLSVDHVRVTLDQLLLKKRFAYKSVVLLSEASLVADSQMIKDQDINNRLLVFLKLFSHGSHGGSMYVDTQCMDDLHYAFRRIANSVWYLTKTVRIPLFPWCIVHCIETRYSEDGTVLAVDTDDIDNRTKTFLVPKRTFKKYDCYTYSVLTDDLDKECTLIHNSKDLKTRDILTFDQSRLAYIERVGKRPEREVSKDAGVTRLDKNAVEVEPVPEDGIVVNTIGSTLANNDNCPSTTSHTPVDSKKE